jgi:polysaccharide deacetylase 2 family uncharacterized protein YibQ
VRSKSWGLVPKVALAAGVVCLTCCFLLAGCGKIKSGVQSLLRANRSSKKSSAPQPSRPAVSGPRLAIILDDLGGDASSVDAIFALHYPLTLSVLPNHPHSTEIAQEAHQRGYQVLLHLPMEAVANETAETEELRPGMRDSEISSLLNSMLRSVPYAAGVNNHQGSLATADAQLMGELMSLLHRHRLFFIDSRTTALTVAYGAAEAAGVPCAFRNVPFLDDVQEIGAIRQQLDLAAKDAREKGQAVAIGHPHPTTLRALADFLPRAESQGIHLVHASDLVH